MTGVVADDWQTDFAEAKKLAKQKQEPLLVHFHAPWCAPCLQMEQSVLNTAQVKQRLGQGITAVKINCETQRAFAKSMGISTLPADLVIAPNGSVLKHSVGAHSVSSYVALIKKHARVQPVQPSNPAAPPKVAQVLSLIHI